MKKLRKILSVLALIVLVGSDFLTSFSYALDDMIEDSVVVQTENEEETESVENEEDNVDEEDTEFAYEDESIEEELETENLTGDIVEEGTGEVFEIGSGEVEELTEETVEGVTGDIAEELTGDVEELTGTVDENTGTVDENTGTGEDIVFEDITYNEAPIIGEKTYNDVTVRVEALIGIFPEGTDLTIEPIKWGDLLVLKDKLVDEREEVKEDTTVVAFDITFRYEGEEVQPKEGEKVKVTFDYSKNENLLEADKNENQEVKVYHIEDMDNNGKKINQGEEVVKDVTNKVESEEEGIAVVDAESFSIYAVVTTTGNPDSVTVTHHLNGGYWMEDHSTVSKPIVYTCNNNSCETTTRYKTPSKDGYMFMGWYDETLTNRRKDGVATDGMNVYAKWQEFGDLNVYILGSDNDSDKHQYTLMDRNMGALDIYNKSGTINDESRGYYYQWGNNYGFDSHYENPGALSEITKQKVDVANYSWEFPYYGYKFYLNSAKEYANWMSGSVNKSLWGDGNITSKEAKQGPCPAGYYIPSKNDWQGLLVSWNSVNSRAEKNFYFDFLVPSAGIRDRGYQQGNGSKVVDIERYRYASSSRNNNDTKTKAVITLTQTEMDKVPIVSPSSNNNNLSHERGSNGLSVRCFKNVTGSIINISDIDLNGGQKAIISIASGEVVSLQNPVRNTNDEFRGWYTTPNFSGNPIGVGSGLSVGDKLYARWCADGLVDDGTQCVDGYSITFDSNGGSPVSTQTVSPLGTGTRPEDPIKMGYIFTGWFLTGAIEEFDFTWTQITGNITLYAHWNTGESYFTINCNKKRLDVDNNQLLDRSDPYLTGIVITGATDSEIILADYSNRCNLAGYEYTGAMVYGSDDGSGSKLSTTTLLADGTRVIEMYFQPVKNQFTLNSADYTSTVGSSQNGLYYYGAKVTLSGDSSDDCFEWDEWNGLPEGTTNSAQTSFSMPNDSVTVTPSVKENTYNIIFSGNSSSGEMSSINEVKCTESIQLTPNAFGKTGYTFTGWSRASGENTREYSDGQTVSGLSKTNLDNVTLYAVWDKNKYIVTGSVAEGQENMGYLSGSTSTGASLTGLYDFGTNLIFIAIPELGYVFDYWKNGDTILSGTDLGDGTNQLTVIVDQILDIIAFFKPAENTPYTVEHYKQNLDQTGYEFAWSGTMYGTTNEQTNATGTDYEGFNLSGNLVDYQTGIKADGSTVVRLYYDRDMYTVTWDMWEGHLNRRKIDENVPYGTTPIFEWDDEDKYTPKRGREVDTDDIKYDFIFTGWIKDGSAEIIKDLTTQIVTGNVTYTAQYDTGYRYYEVRYHTDEGTGTMVPQSLQLYSSGTLTKNTFTKTGYDFSGWWYEYGDGIEVFYEDEQEINLGVEDDVIKSDAEWEDPLYLDLYAQWKPNTDTKVTVNYYLKDLDADNNVLINSTTEYDTGVEFTGNTDDVVDILSRYGTGIEGYEYSKSIVYGPDYPTGVETGTTTVLADGSRVIDMYYVPSIYQFTLNSESYSSTAGSSESTGYYYGARVTLSGNSNDDCFTWSGWTTSGITLSDNTLHQTWFAMPANDVEITPSTMENTYNIIFNGNGSNSGTMSPMNGIRCTESTGLAINTFEKSGHTFTGWSTTVGGSKEYVDGAIVDRLSTGADVNLYAVWDINEYNINANVAMGDHGSLQWSGSGIYDFGETLAIIAVPELGYLFDYWEVNGSTELPEGATTGENQLTIVVNQILDIVAHFTENAKTVTVNYYEMNTGGLYPNDPYDTDSLTGLVGQTKSINPESRIGFHLDDNRSNTGVTISENSEDNVINIYYERERYIIETSGRSYQMPTDTHVYFVNIIPDNQPHYQYYYGEEIEIEYSNPEGWNFSGWYDATSEGKGFPSDEVSLDSRNVTFHMPDHNVWVEPIMEHIPYTLSFTGYEGAEVTNFDYCSFGTGDRETYYDYSECLPYLNKEGYWFNGWDDENGSWVRRYNEYSPDPILNRMPAHDYKLVANFEPRNNMSYEKYYYFQDIEGTGYTLSGDLTDWGNNDGVTDQEMPGREPLYNIDGFQYSGFGYSGVMLPRDQWPIIKPIGDNYINYYYDRKVYLVDVNYDNKIMSITGAGEYRYEAPVNLVATVNTGYQFSGFSSYQGELLSSGSVYNFTMPDSFVDIYADANPIEYSIEYEPNGGELDPYSSYVNYTVESSDLSIGNPYKDGYKFLGWTGGVVSGGIEGEEDIVEPTRDLIIPGGSIGDRKYYANWEPDEVKVTVNYYLKKIDSENNTLIDGVDIYLAGVEYTGLSDDIVNIFSRYGTGIEGYHYDHAAVFSGGERTGATETTVLPDGSREINMYYIPNKYNFTLNSDLYSSTEGSSEITGYYYGAVVRLSGGSNNDCFTWSGWATSGIILSDNTVKQTLFTMPANDVEVTPSTTEKTYNIIFNGNGSTLGEMSPMNGVRCTESIGLTLNSFGKKGYTFTGWSRTSGDNIREYKDGQIVTGLLMNDGENVNLYVVWDIDWYTVTFDLNGGSLTGDMTLTTGYTIETPAISLENFIPVKSGYTLIGWYRDDTLVDHIAGGEIGDYILIAHWKADSDTLYTVKYYKQNLNGGYDVWTGMYTGETDIEVTALVKDFTGFTYSGGNENNVTTGVVIGDGSLVLKLYYDRNEYEVTTGEVEHGTMGGGTGNQRYGKRITFTAHPDAGYIISKWLRDGNEILSGGVIWTGEELEIEVDTGMEIGVEFKAKEDTPYYVEYYKEKLEGGYEVWTGTYSGTTDQEAVAQELSFTGFTYDSGDERNERTGNIDGDGSRVLRLYYARNTNNVVYVYTGKVPSGQLVPETTGYKYEATVTVAEAPNVLGYNFSWSTGVSSFTMPDEKVVITGTWTANTGTKYAVQHMLQNIEDDGYTQTGEDQILSGETDELTNAQANNYTGFTVQSFSQTGIKGDESTIVVIKYDRNEYEVTTGEVEHGTIEGGAGSQRYGKRIIFTAHPDAGYVISKWLRDGNEILSGGVIWTGEELEIEVDTGMEIGVEFKAKEDTPYYVEYYKEKLGGGYDVWTGTYSGTTDQEAVAQELSFTGFTFSGGNQSNITSGVIAGDGSLVLKLFYDRNKYTITWKDGNDEVLKTDQLFYGAMPEYTGETPTKIATAQYSYTFNNTWTPAIEIVTTGVTYTAQFDVEVNKYLITFVDGDGKIVQSGMVVYGEMPQYTGTTPTKTATAQYSYTFNNTWTPAIESVTTGVTYTAQFDSTVNEYTISIVPSDTDMGTVSPSEINVSYGSTIVESGNIITVGGVEVKATPKSADVQYTYEFDSWTNTCGSELIGTCTIQANFRKILNKYSITWMNDDGSLIDTTMVGYGVIPTHAKPTKTETEEYRYVFVGWDPEVVAVVGDAEYTAVFNAEEKEKHSEGENMSGGGGRKSTIDNAENSDNQHGSAEENSDLFTGDYYTNSGNVDEETLSLYEWAHENDITTIDTLEEANAYGYLTRGHMAKMVVNFAQNVLGKTIPTEYPDKCNWKDKESERESSEIKEYAKKSCALGLMGIYVEEFMPNKVLDRAEFGTIISRLLWGDKYNVIDTDHRGYYEDHLGALKKHGILSQTDNPEERRELRKWVWLVFRRISEKLKK